MKILFSGDTHGEIGTIKSILREAKKNECDRVFVLGDFGYWEHTAEGVYYLDRVDHYAKLYGIPVYFLDGNHDKTSLLLENYDVLDGEEFIHVRDYVKYSPRGHRWTWDGLRFASFGGAYSVDKDWRLHMEKKRAEQIAHQNSYRTSSQQKSIDTSETLWFPEEEMTDIDMDQFLKDDSPVDIILAHDMPRGANPKWNRKNLEECWPNQDRLQKAVLKLQPKLYLHGHLHYAYTDKVRCGDDDKFTTVIGLNADGEKGTTMVMDLKGKWGQLDD